MFGVTDHIFDIMEETVEDFSRRAEACRDAADLDGEDDRNIVRQLAKASAYKHCAELLAQAVSRAHLP